jgi:hypothetical protein
MRRSRLWLATLGFAWLLQAAGRGPLAARAQDYPPSAESVPVDGSTSWSGGESGSVLPPLSGDYGELNNLFPSNEPSPAGSGGGVEAPCATCGGGSYPYNRCGCSSGLFPYFTGPGHCDNWCVGPHWDVAVDGLMLFRQDADWDRVVADVGSAADVIGQFDHAPGARLFVTGYNDASFGLQVGYEGVNQFTGTASFPQAGSVRDFGYESRMNSLEVNFLRKTESPWKPLAGVRYFELGEDFSDFTTVDKPLPVPADPPAANVFFQDAGTELRLRNQMFGFQLGILRDVWRLNRWITVEPFGNAGVYCNNFRRRDIDRTVTTIVAGDDLSTPENEFSQTSTETSTVVTRKFQEVAFLGEAGLTVVTRLNRCVALRGGYQILGVTNVGQGLDGYFASGFNGDALVLHGLHFGLEYER